MKILGILLMVLVLSVVVKFNPVLNRYEIFDRGNKIGYAKENKTLNRTEFYNKKGKEIGRMRYNKTLKRWEEIK